MWSERVLITKPLQKLISEINDNNFLNIQWIDDINKKIIATLESDYRNIQKENKCDDEPIYMLYKFLNLIYDTNMDISKKLDVYEGLNDIISYTNSVINKINNFILENFKKIPHLIKEMHVEHVRILEQKININNEDADFIIYLKKIIDADMIFDIKDCDDINTYLIHMYIYMFPSSTENELKKYYNFLYSVIGDVEIDDDRYILAW